MEKTFELDIFNYVYKMDAYKFVALAYEKIQGATYIDCDIIATPCIILQSECLANLIQNNDAENLQTYIDKIIQDKNLNQEFCEKLKINASLRYLLVLGFHDAKIANFKQNGNEVVLQISCDECNMTPNTNKDICSLTLQNANTINIDNIENLFIDDMRISYSQRKIGFQFTLHNREEKLTTKIFQVFCDNAILS